jgi:hypothetical protein
MRNSPLKGMLNAANPIKQKTHPKHPVTPPTVEQSKKSKGTLKETTWSDRLFKKFKSSNLDIKLANLGKKGIEKFAKKAGWSEKDIKGN